MQLLIERLIVIVMTVMSAVLFFSWMSLPTQAETARNIASFSESQNQVQATQPYLISNR